MTIEVSGIILNGYTGAGDGTGGGTGGTGGASSLSELVDVSFVGTPTNGQVLKFNSATYVWQNSGISSDIRLYIQANLLGVNGISVNTQGDKHYIGFDLSANGDVVPVSVADGNLDLRLASVNPTPGTYGGVNQMPVITVDSKGRVTQVTTTPVVSSSGTVTYVAMSGGTTGLVVSGGPVMSSGQFTIGGCLKVESGGTGATTLSGYVVANGTDAFTASTTIPGIHISGDIPGTAAYAHTLRTPRTFTIGQAARTFDGTGNISWSLTSIGALDRTGDKLQGALDLAVPSQINLTNYINLSTTTSNVVEIVAGSGSTISSFGVAAAGTWRKILFSTDATVIHSIGTTGLKLPGALNAQISQGDILEAVSLGAGLWSCTVSSRAQKQLSIVEVVSNITAELYKHYLVVGSTSVVRLPAPGSARGARIRISNVSGTSTPSIDFMTYRYRGTAGGTMTMTDTHFDIELTDGGSATIGWV